MAPAAALEGERMLRGHLSIQLGDAISWHSLQNRYRKRVLNVENVQDSSD